MVVDTTVIKQHEPVLAVQQQIQDKDRRTAAWLWVLHGGAWLAVMLYCYTRWVVSGNFTPNTLGRGAEPGWYFWLVRFVEVVCGIGITGYLIWRHVVKPKMRTGRFTFTGLFFLSGFLMFFQEPWINWTSYQFLYATTFVNFGSYLNFVPFWSSPNGQLVPFPLVYMAAYVWMTAFAGYLGSLYMTRQRTRDAATSKGRLIGKTLLWMLFWDLVVEMIMVRTQLISYGSTVRSLTLWPGTDHQFPLYEPFHWAGTWLMLTCLHFFRDAQGRSLPERGIELLPIRREGTRTFARFLAIMGACQLTILFAFNIPYQLGALHSGPMPDVFVNEPYRVAGVCGPQTDYACPDPQLPIPRKSSRTNRIAGVGEPGRPTPTTPTPATR